MRQYASLPIERLVSDVAVDPVHVRELADSIKLAGPISPVIVQEETLSLIDGFHRVAAMRELGFDEVDCILTPCDDETFWDLRIMAASLHKAVTFARVIDWVDEAFQKSPWKTRHTSAYSLFNQARLGKASREVQDWAQNKASKWGLAVHTIENWLYTKQTLAPELLEEAKTSPTGERLSVGEYRAIAGSLIGKPDLQQRLAQKARDEDLTTPQIEQVGKALRQAGDQQEVETILSYPVGRTADELIRAAKVDTILRSPQVIPPQVEKRLEFSGKVLEYWLHLQQVTSVAKALSPDILALLSREERERLVEGGENCVGEIQRINDELLRSSGRVIEAGHQLGPSRLV